LSGRQTSFSETARLPGALSSRGDHSSTEIAMNKRSLVNRSLIALAAATFLAGISAAAAAPGDNTKTPSAKMQNEMQSTNAVPRPSDTLSLSAAQRKTAWQDLYMDSLNQEAPSGFNPTPGATVPNTIVTAPVTAKAAGDVPALKPYTFAMVQKKLVIVNPSDHKIADVITP